MLTKRDFLFVWKTSSFHNKGKPLSLNVATWLFLSAGIRQEQACESLVFHVPSSGRGNRPMEQCKISKSTIHLTLRCTRGSWVALISVTITVLITRCNQDKVSMVEVYFLLDVAVINAWVLRNKCLGNKQTENSTSVCQRWTSTCWTCPPGSKGKQCKNWQRKGRREKAASRKGKWPRESRFGGGRCNIVLCKGDCWLEWHSQPFEDL